MAVRDVRYRRDLPTDAELRLTPNLDRKRVLELGCGRGDNALTFAARGAHVIAIDHDTDALDAGRAAAAEAELKVEFRAGDLADLAFLRADSIDFAFSTYALGEVTDLDRVFRQAHRVLRSGGVFVFAYEHPLSLCLGRDDIPSGGLPLGRLEVTRPYASREPVTLEREGAMVTLHPRSIADVFAGVRRAGFAVEQFLELEPTDRPDAGPAFPTAMVWRVRKEGA